MIRVRNCYAFNFRLFLAPNTFIRLIVAIALLLAFSTTCYAWSGKVVGISDGDTIKVLRDGKQVKIRLHGIDCHEKV